MVPEVVHLWELMLTLSSGKILGRNGKWRFVMFAFSDSLKLHPRAWGPMLLVVLICGLSACAPQSPAEPVSTPVAEGWSYNGANGPAHWGKFGAACENTSAAHQSPIDIETAQLVQDERANPIVPHYLATNFELENNGHSIEAVPTDPTANSVEFDGKLYTLQQFHFHAASEHELNGNASAAELHLVHESSDGAILVLGVMLQVGPTNSALEELFNSIPQEITKEAELLPTQIDPADLLPQSLVSAQYDGSLTTPPCSEGVKWNVFLTPVTISSEQLSDYTAVYPDNRRPLQPLHDRTVTKVD